VLVPAGAVVRVVVVMEADAGGWRWRTPSVVMVVGIGAEGLGRTRGSRVRTGDDRYIYAQRLLFGRAQDSS
jgi:hypothetical protein